MDKQISERQIIHHDILYKEIVDILKNIEVYHNNFIFKSIMAKGKLVSVVKLDKLYGLLINIDGYKTVEYREQEYNADGISNMTDYIYRLISLINEED